MEAPETEGSTLEVQQKHKRKNPVGWKSGRAVLKAAATLLSHSPSNARVGHEQHEMNAVEVEYHDGTVEVRHMGQRKYAVGSKRGGRGGSNAPAKVTKGHAVAAAADEAAMSEQQDYDEPGTSYRFHFYPEHDISLLKQVLADLPFQARYGKTDEAWNQVATQLQEVGVMATGRAARQRFKHIVDLYRSNDIRNLRKSGTEEDYDARDELLQEVIDIIDSGNREREETQQQKKRDEEVARQMRDDAMVTLKDKAERVSSDEDANRVSGKRGSTSKLEAQLASSLAARDLRKQNDCNLERMRLDLESKKIDYEREKLKVEAQKVEAEVAKVEKTEKTEHERIALERERLQMEMKDREAARKTAAESQQAQVALILELVKVKSHRD